MHKNIYENNKTQKHQTHIFYFKKKSQTHK